MTYDEWVARFRPLCSERRIVSSDLHQCMVDPHGPQRLIELDTDPRNVWTVVEGDDEGWYVVPGRHLVNRVGLIRTERQWKDEDEALCVEYYPGCRVPNFECVIRYKDETECEEFSARIATTSRMPDDELDEHIFFYAGDYPEAVIRRWYSEKQSPEEWYIVDEEGGQ